MVYCGKALSNSQARILPYLFAVDLVIGLGLTVASLAYFEVPSMSSALALCASVYVVHVLLWSVSLRQLWRPIRMWERSSHQRPEQLLEADDTVESLPMRFTSVYALSWAVYWGGIAVCAWSWFPGIIKLGRQELVTVSFEVLASLIGASVLVFPLVRLLLLDTKTAIVTQIEQRGLPRKLVPTSLGPRFLALAIGIALAPVTWQVGSSWLILAESQRELTELQLKVDVEAAVEALDEGREPALSEFELVEELGETFASSQDASSAPDELTLVSVIDKRTERVSVAARTSNGRWLVAEAPVEIDGSDFWLAIGGLFAAVIGWSLATAAGSVRLLARPLARLESALERIVEVGDLRAVGRIPIAYEDEVATLVRRFNAMLELFEELAKAALAIADGDLRVKVVGQGDLQTAFSTMVTGLHELVDRIRAASFELTAEAAQIQANTSEQERAMTRQSGVVVSTREAMERLSRSASSIASSATVVLDNAERARGHSDEVGAQIAEFTSDVARISELLELIREVADRSDLLALNGSLEATRAGEAGRGFSLVAAEMRRLAERVTNTVDDVRTSLSDIEGASAASVAATDAGRELTTNTAATASQIVEVTQVQSDETTQVTASVGMLSELISESVAATTQTRAAAESLREQAMLLQEMIDHFQTED